MKTYLVGGAVRDQLLNRTVTEKDWVVVGATPQQLLAKGFRPVGKDFPVFLHPTSHEEYALARTERKIGPGYAGFACYAAPDVTLEQDLLRRDLTINAMAQTIDGELIDPFNGQADLKNQILRHVSPAFAEDPVRILRIARFAARYNFAIASETQQLMSGMVRTGEVDALVAERVWQELQRALTEPSPAIFFTVLRNCGALARLFPELDALFGVPAAPNWHPEIDTGIHTLLAVEQATALGAETATLFAVLLHDLGKALTSITQWPKHHGHETAGLTPIRNLCKRYRIPRDYQELALLVSQYHLHCHKASELTAKTLLSLLEKLDAFRRPARFQQFLLACQADAQGRKGLNDKLYPQADYLRQAQLAAADIALQPLLDKGLTGQALGDEIRLQRLKKLQIYIASK